MKMCLWQFPHYALADSICTRCGNWVSREQARVTPWAIAKKIVCPMCWCQLHREDCGCDKWDDFEVFLAGMALEMSKAM